MDKPAKISFNIGTSLINFDQSFLTIRPRRGSEKVLIINKPFKRVLVLQSAVYIFWVHDENKG